jgi:hypothetical protein
MECSWAIVAQRTGHIGTNQGMRDERNGAGRPRKNENIPEPVP